MKYKDTKCRECKTDEKALFFMPKAIDKYDYFCEECLIEEIKNRAEDMK